MFGDLDKPAVKTLPKGHFHEKEIQGNIVCMDVKC